MVHTLDFRLIFFGMAHEQCSCFAVQWVIRIGVSQELWQEDFKNVDHIYKLLTRQTLKLHSLLDVPNIGDQVWLMTSRQTEPLLIR